MLNGDLSNCSGLPFSGISATTANAAIIGNASSQVSPVLMTNGQLLIGSSSGAPSAGTLTPGALIQLLSSSGAVAINALGCLVNIQVFRGTSVDVSGTYTRSAGVSSSLVVLVAGGGGGIGISTGAGDTALRSSSGGGGGAMGIKYYASAPATATYIAGKFGAGSVSAPTVGGDAQFVAAAQTLTVKGGRQSASGDRISLTTAGSILRSNLVTTVAGSTTGLFDYFQNGAFDMRSCICFTNSTGVGGKGAKSGIGSEGGIPSALNQTGGSASGMGGGGAGVFVQGANLNVSGGNGAPGAVIVYEYA